MSSTLGVPTPPAHSGDALPPVTMLLRAIDSGEPGAVDRLYAVVYDELRRIARAYLRRGAQAETMATTALVHEAYVKLAGPEQWSPRDRHHFFALVARAMRQVLIDHARSRLRQKRGGGAALLALDDLEIPAAERQSDLLALDAALAKLEASDPELARLVEWRYFGGRSVEEIAGMLGISDRTVKRRWQLARAFLHRELSAARVS